VPVNRLFLYGKINLLESCFLKSSAISLSALSASSARLLSFCKRFYGVLTESLHVLIKIIIHEKISTRFRSDNAKGYRREFVANLLLDLVVNSQGFGVDFSRRSHSVNTVFATTSLCSRDDFAVISLHVLSL
jgi:hypothetical protein